MRRSRTEPRPRGRRCSPPRALFAAPLRPVADTIAHWAEEADCSRFNIVIEQSDMPEWKVVKSMTLFAQEVIPRVRAKAPGARLLRDRELAAVATPL